MSLLYTRIARQRRRYDPDARLYLRLVENALGAATTRIQREAVSNFIAAEKAASRWASHKRIYLPIWGNAAANAICMASRTSGTFVGGMTHAAGYVQGNGSTGYFNSGASPNGVGMTNGSGYLLALCTQAASTTGKCLLGSYFAAATETNLVHQTTTVLRYDAFNNVAGQKSSSSLALASQIGVLSGVRSASGWDIRRRVTAGATSLHSSTGAAVGGVPTTNIFCMALAYLGGAQPINFHDGRFGVFAFGTEMSNSGTDAYTLALKTLWETCTGLTLP